MTNDPVLSENLPAAQEYVALRDAMGWGRIDLDTARRTLDAAAYTVCLRDAGDAGRGGVVGGVGGGADDGARHDAASSGRLVGLARVMGDGALYFFLADLIVAPDFRGGGHGETLMRAVTDYFDRAAKPGATIALVPMAGREAFYERFGFVATPHGAFGHGMHYVKVRSGAQDRRQSPRAGNADEPDPTGPARRASLGGLTGD